MVVVPNNFKITQVAESRHVSEATERTLNSAAAKFGVRSVCRHVPREHLREREHPINVKVAEQWGTIIKSIRVHITIKTGQGGQGARPKVQLDFGGSRGTPGHVTLN